MASLTPPTLVTSTPALRAVARRLRGQRAFAIDTESNSLHAYREQVCLVQISIPDADYLIDPLSDSIDMSLLGPLFADVAIEKVLHACEYDVISLRRDFAYTFANLFDTMWSARILGWPKVGLADILKQYFSVTLDKRWQRFDWGQRPLPLDALNYARFDTHYLLRLRDVQLQELNQRDRLDEAREVFEELAQSAAPPRDEANLAEGFRRIKGVHDLDAVGRAILRELHVYRDHEASRLNRPPFKVIGDETLVDIARTRPAQLNHLKRVPGMTERQIARHGRNLLQAVTRGRKAQPPPLQPRKSIDPGVLDRYERLRVWRRNIAAERGVESDVILSNATLMAIAHRHPRALSDLESIDGLGPWRRKTYGPEILKALGRS
jgi:ribonuclease D